MHDEIPEKILVTARCFLRPLCPEDLPALAAIMQDPVAMKAYERVFTDAQILEWIARNQKRYREKGMGLWAVCLQTDGTVIGQCGIVPQTESGESFLEIGYLFRRAFWHQGYATEAAAACRDYAFRRFGCDRVCSIVKHNNFASQAVARRMGMKVSRRIVYGPLLSDQLHDQFCITRGEWAALAESPSASRP